MPLLEKQLFIKRSTLTGAGKGLFTKKPIARGTKIVEYKGEITTWKEVDCREGKNGYIYYVNRKHVIDAWNNKEQLARYANDAKGFTRTKGITNNCSYEHEGVRVFLVAMKNIPTGAELFVAYGKEYWDIMKENHQLASAEKEKSPKAAGRPRKNAGSASNADVKTLAKAKRATKANPKSLSNASAKGVGKAKVKSVAKANVKTGGKKSSVANKRSPAATSRTSDVARRA